MPASFQPLSPARTLAIVILGAILSCCGQPVDRSNAALASSEQTVPVRIAAVSQISSDDTLRFAGISRARQRATLTFQVDGVLRSRDADIGQQVVTGQRLAQLYNPQLQPSRDAAQSRLEQLRADLAQARRDLMRIEELHERAVSPLSDLEQQRSRVEGLLAVVNNAEASLQQSESLLAENTLKAPFSGIIEAVLLEPGEFVQSGQAVIQLAARDDMEIEIRAPAHLLRNVHVGQTLPIWSSLSGAHSSGQVLEIGTSSSGTNTLFPLIVALQGDDIRAGEAYEVGVPRRTEPARVIPINAVMRSAGGLSVFRFDADSSGDAGTVSRVPVQISELLGDQAVLAGNALAPQDAVVYAGLTRLADSDRVRVLP